MEEQKNIKDHIIDYLLDDGEEKAISPVLSEWLAEDVSNQKEFEQYKKIWKASGSYTEPNVYDSDLAWEKINMINGQQINTRTYLKNISYVISGVAASLLIMFALSFMGVFEKNTEVLVSMNADYGNRSEIVLPDGSVVKLNSGSEITC